MDNAKIFSELMSKSRSSAKISEKRVQPLLVWEIIDFPTPLPLPHLLQFLFISPKYATAIIGPRFSIAHFKFRNLQFYWFESQVFKTGFRDFSSFTHA